MPLPKGRHQIVVEHFRADLQQQIGATRHVSLSFNGAVSQSSIPPIPGGQRKGTKCPPLSIGFFGVRAALRLILFFRQFGRFIDGKSVITPEKTQRESISKKCVYLFCC